MPPRPAPSAARSGGHTALRTGWARDDRGSASVQLVILMPVMFSIMFLGLQAALMYHARTVAIAAAEEGARAAAAEFGTTSQGIDAAASFVDLSGGADVLEHVSIAGNRSATTATITVSGTSLSVIPGWSPTIQQSANLPVERITTE